MGKNEIRWTKEQLNAHNSRISASKKHDLPKVDQVLDKINGVPQKSNKRPFGRSKFGKRRVAGEMNGTEKRFLEEYITPRIQAGEFTESWFEAVTLKLATELRYTPDFMVQDKDGYIIFFEVKGTTKTKPDKDGIRKEIPFIADDGSAVKLKVSPHLFPFQFYIAHPRSKQNGSGWNIIEK